jgi:hypothetical protein
MIGTLSCLLHRLQLFLEKGTPGHHGGRVGVNERHPFWEKPLKLTMKIRYTEKIFESDWDFWENDPLSKPWWCHWVISRLHIYPPGSFACPGIDTQVWNVGFTSPRMTWSKVTCPGSQPRWSLNPFHLRSSSYEIVRFLEETRLLTTQLTRQDGRTDKTTRHKAIHMICHYIYHYNQLHTICKYTILPSWLVCEEVNRKPDYITIPCRFVNIGICKAVTTKVPFINDTDKMYSKMNFKHYDCGWGKCTFFNSTLERRFFCLSAMPISSLCDTGFLWYLTL